MTKLDEVGLAELRNVKGGWGYRFDYQAPPTLIIIDDPRDWGVR